MGEENAEETKMVSPIVLVALSRAREEAAAFNELPASIPIAPRTADQFYIGDRDSQPEEEDAAYDSSDEEFAAGMHRWIEENREKTLLEESPESIHSRPIGLAASTRCPRTPGQATVQRGAR